MESWLHFVYNINIFFFFFSENDLLFYFWLFQRKIEHWSGWTTEMWTCALYKVLLMLSHKYQCCVRSGYTLVFRPWNDLRCFAASLQLCHTPSGPTPKGTLYPPVFALHDELHFPQPKKKKKRLWESARATVSNLKSAAISEIRKEVVDAVTKDTLFSSPWCDGHATFMCQQARWFISQVFSYRSFNNVITSNFNTLYLRKREKSWTIHHDLPRI